MTTGNGSTTVKTLWNGKKKDKEERKYRLDLQGFTTTQNQGLHSKRKISVLAEVRLNEETLPNGEVAKNGGAICGLLYDALLEALVKGKDGTFTIWEVSFA